MRKDHHFKENPIESWEQSFYRTGSTHPPKSHRGLLAILLVITIFFCGIFTAFSLLNIHLFRSLPVELGPVHLGDGSGADSAECIRFVKPGPTANEITDSLAEEASVPGPPWLGVSVKQLSSFEKLYYQLPSGLYITQVEPATDAAAKGLAPGDILLSIDGASLTDAASLQELLCSHAPGDTVSVTVYRNNEQRRVNLKLSNAQ